MSFGKTLINLRKSRNLTQEELAAKLYVTRQAVSRWERDEVVPGIDMLKLIAVTLDEPIVHLLDMPEHLCESCGMILRPTTTAPTLRDVRMSTSVNGAMSREHTRTKPPWRL